MTIYIGGTLRYQVNIIIDIYSSWSNLKWHTLTCDISLIVIFSCLYPKMYITMIEMPSFTLFLKCYKTSVILLVLLFLTFLCLLLKEFGGIVWFDDEEEGCWKSRLWSFWRILYYSRLNNLLRLSWCYVMIEMVLLKLRTIIILENKNSSSSKY